MCSAIHFYLKRISHAVFCGQQFANGLSLAFGLGGGLRFFST
jgi:hypothetical protein